NVAPDEEIKQSTIVPEFRRCSANQPRGGSMRTVTALEAELPSGAATDGLEVTVAMRRFAPETRCDAPVRLTEMGTGNGTRRAYCAQDCRLRRNFRDARLSSIARYPAAQFVA